MSLYARLITVKQERGDSTYEEDTFAGQVLSGNHSLPALIDAYLKAIGNVVDTASLRYQLQMPAWPNETGDFGRVGVHTHWMFMSMPSPQVVARRIQEDLRVTATPGISDWNLPQDLRPEEENAGMYFHPSSHVLDITLTYLRKSLWLYRKLRIR